MSQFVCKPNNTNSRLKPINFRWYEQFSVFITLIKRSDWPIYWYNVVLKQRIVILILFPTTCKRVLLLFLISYVYYLTYLTTKCKFCNNGRWNDIERVVSWLVLFSTVGKLCSDKFVSIVFLCSHECCSNLWAMSIKPY